jgi:hypothetical protein
MANIVTINGPRPRKLHPSNGQTDAVLQPLLHCTPTGAAEYSKEVSWGVELVENQLGG